MHVILGCRHVRIWGHRASRKKAAGGDGIDGIWAEFILDAAAILSSSLVQTFNHLPENHVPAAWGTGHFHPVYKANHKGIIDFVSLAKQYTIVCQSYSTGRIDQGKVKGQAGYRKGFAPRVTCSSSRLWCSRSSKTCYTILLLLGLQKPSDLVLHWTLCSFLEQRGMTGRQSLPSIMRWPHRPVSVQHWCENPATILPASQPPVWSPLCQAGQAPQR